MAGVTVWKGIEGYGASGHLRSSRFPDANIGLPITVELIDTPEQVESFLAVVKELAPRSFVTREKVTKVQLESAEALALDDPDPRRPRT